MDSNTRIEVFEDRVQLVQLPRQEQFSRVVRGGVVMTASIGPDGNARVEFIRGETRIAIYLDPGCSPRVFLPRVFMPGRERKPPSYWVSDPDGINRLVNAVLKMFADA